MPDIAQQLRDASANRKLLTQLHLKVEDELIDRRDRGILMANRNGLVAFDRDSTPSPVIRMGTREAIVFVLQILAEHYDTEEQDAAVTEPTGPRIYVQNHHGKQGHIVRFDQKDDGRVCGLVQWYAPGTEPVWRTLDTLKIITSDEVERCPHGQTRDECGSGENQCELCLADEDEEGDMIEESMGLR